MLFLYKYENFFMNSYLMGWSYATNRAKLHMAKFTKQMQKYLVKEMKKQ